MLPTIERRPRRSMYSSATAAWEPFAFASSTATRVSPRSADTRIVFFICSAQFRIGRHARSSTEGSPREPSLPAETRLDVDALKDSNRQEGSEHGGPSVTHHRQRNARDGHDAEVHPDVDEHLEQELDGDTAGDQDSVSVLRERHDPQRPPDEKGVKG